MPQNTFIEEYALDDSRFVQGSRRIQRTAQQTDRVLSRSVDTAKRYRSSLIVGSSTVLGQRLGRMQILNKANNVADDAVNALWHTGMTSPQRARLRAARQARVARGRWLQQNFPTLFGGGSASGSAGATALAAGGFMGRGAGRRAMVATALGLGRTGSMLARGGALGIGLAGGMMLKRGLDKQPEVVNAWKNVTDAANEASDALGKSLAPHVKQFIQGLLGRPASVDRRTQEQKDLQQHRKQWQEELADLRSQVAYARFLETQRQLFPRAFGDSEREMVRLQVMDRARRRRDEHIQWVTDKDDLDEARHALATEKRRAADPRWQKHFQELKKWRESQWMGERPRLPDPRPMTDPRQYALGGGDLGQLGVTPQEMARLRGGRAPQSPKAVQVTIIGGGALANAVREITEQLLTDLQRRRIITVN
jgi:hypothetical protein